MDQKNIMIIDDDVHIGNMLEETLKLEGHDVTRAYSGTEALMALKTIKPDLILLDLMLPGLTGEELLPLIQGIPVIVVSAKLDRENKVQDIFCPNGLFERMHFLMGVENTCISLLTEPEACEALVAKIADTKIKLIHGALPCYKPDVYTFLDDYAHAQGLFISKDLFRTMFKPHLKRIVDAVHEEGVLCKLHCCGKMQELAEDYMEIGVDAMDPMQPINDIVSIQKLFDHKIGIMGGLDVTGVIDNPSATAEQIRSEVRRCLNTYGPNGGYIMYCASTQLRTPGAFDPDGVFGILLDEYHKHPLSQIS